VVAVVIQLFLLSLQTVAAGAVVEQVLLAVLVGVVAQVVRGQLVGLETHHQHHQVKEIMVVLLQHQILMVQAEAAALVRLVHPEHLTVMVGMVRHHL
jgi:hypothetical protein